MQGFLAVALAGALAVTGVAHAQDGAGGGMDCVYLALADNYGIVAGAFIYCDLSEEEFAEADQAVEAAQTSCAATHSHSAEQREAAGELGILAASIASLSGELLISGVGEAAVRGAMDVDDAFTDEDVEAIYEPDWRGDAAFYGQLKAMMLSAGIPDEADLIDVALSILELAALVEDATYVFMLADDAPNTVP